MVRRRTKAMSAEDGTHEVVCVLQNIAVKVLDSDAALVDPALDLCRLPPDLGCRQIEARIVDAGSDCDTRDYRPARSYVVRAQRGVRLPPELRVSVNAALKTNGVAALGKSSSRRVRQPCVLANVAENLGHDMRRRAVHRFDTADFLQCISHLCKVCVREATSAVRR